MYFLPSEKKSTVKGKNLLPRGANSYLLEHVLEGLDVQEKQTGDYKKKKKKKKKCLCLNPFVD